MNVVMRHNIMTGNDHLVIEDNRHDFHQEIARAAYADMLHDTERNKLYEVGLKNAIQEIHNRGESAYVLDIGTGSGLLSMMACRNGADKITACEAFSPIADCAFQVIADNGMSDKIHIVRKRSTDMSVGEGCDMPKRANILVTEVFDTELIGEGAIPTFEHAHRVLLEKGCIVIPSVANMYVQCVSSPLLRNLNVFKNINIKIDNNRNISIIVPEDISECSGIAGVHDLQLDQITCNDFIPLSDPIQIFRFDYTGESSINKTGDTKMNFLAKNNGNCDAIFMWWDLEMTPNGSECILSCAPHWAHPTPFNMQWRDHWMQAIYYPISKIDIFKDDEIVISSFHDEYSLWFDLFHIDNYNEVLSIEDKILPLCDCGAHLSCCKTRIGMLNDHERLSKYMNTMSKIITSDTICLSISDGSFLPLIAAKLGAKRVYVFEEKYRSQSIIRSYLTANPSLKAVIIFNEISTDNLFNGDKIDLILAEPFFSQTTLPWDDLHYGYIIENIQNHLSDDVVIIPKKAILKAIGVRFKDLHKIRSVLDTCEGFEMKSFDELIMSSSVKCDEKCEPHPLWEYPCYPLTKEFTLNTFTITKDRSSSFLSTSINASDKIHFTSIHQEFNAVALWMEYILDDEYSITNGIISEPSNSHKIEWYRNCRQAIYLIDNPKKVEQGQKLTYAIEFKPKKGELNLEFTVI